MQIFKKYKRVIAFLIMFFAVNRFFSFILIPFSASGYELWHGFEQKKGINCIYTGSSHCICDINPEVVDKATGLVSYNMGSSMQSIQSSYNSIKQAIDQKKVSKVVLVIDPEIMEMDRNTNFRADACFQKYMTMTLSPVKKVVSDIEFITCSDFIGTPSSINYFIPWTYDRVSDVGNNIKEKLSGKIIAKAEHRDLNGFLPSDKVYENGDRYVDYDSASKWSSEKSDLHKIEMTDENISTLKDICEICKENKVDLLAITAPFCSAFTYYDFESYTKFGSEIKSILKKYKYQYIDFNYLKKEHFNTIDTSKYRDNGHLNTNGANEFSLILAGILNGNDAKGLFVK